MTTQNLEIHLASNAKMNNSTPPKPLEVGFCHTPGND
jgi:hypothetical protein